MPHCIIEYSKEVDSLIDMNELIDAVHEGAKNSGLFDEDDIKTRAVPYEYYRTGEKTENFIHISVRILSGRNTEQKSNLCLCVYEKAMTILSHFKRVTVEICEIDRDSFSKCIL